MDLEKTRRSSDRKDHLANERTFLAWIRTSIGIMAFGFVVEKFAIFIKQVSVFLASQKLSESHVVSTAHQGYSSTFGILLVGIGAMMGLLSYMNYRKVEKQIDAEDFTISQKLPIAVTALVIGMGIFLVVYLLNP